jgi:hypothetical protein
MPLDLKAIKERLAKATPGPWRAIDESDYDVRVYEGDIASSDNSRVVARYSGDERVETFSDRDADLIAHAPADLASLVAEVESLRALLREAIHVGSQEAASEEWLRLCERGRAAIREEP